MSNTQPPTPEPSVMAESPKSKSTEYSPTKSMQKEKLLQQDFDEISLNTPTYIPNDSRRQNKSPSERLSPTSSTSTQSRITSSLPEVSPQEFILIVNEIRQAIRAGKLPLRIHQGSSGSYFCQDHMLRTQAVFKPKDEEPYGHLNPKWTKWFHRNLFPCCFGRSSLIPNVGYLSEASASLIDRQLKIGLVPRTEVVKLASASFSYPRRVLAASKRTQGEVPLPLKIGSFQLFLEGFENASSFLARNPWPASCALDQTRKGSKDRTSLDPPTHDDDTLPMLSHDHHSQKKIWSIFRQRQFRLELEKLILFDYLIRNTDRGLDNWMIKISEDDSISIAAIDHGLAFPHQHPSNWRSYPYGWLQLPPSLLDRPFSESVRMHFLSLLTSTSWWQNTELLLIKLNHLDPDFNRKMFDKQLEVIRGQAWNLVECLKTPGEGPLELCRRPPVIVFEHEENDLDDEVQGAELPSVPASGYQVLVPPAKTYQGVSPTSPNISWPDPFLAHEISSDTNTRKKVIRKLKTLTSRPCFASC